MSTLSLTRDKIYKTVARQLHGVVPCWVCGTPVSPAQATLEHIKPRSEGGNSHQENLAISHDFCNNQRHIQGTTPRPTPPAGTAPAHQGHSGFSPEGGGTHPQRACAAADQGQG